MLLPRQILVHILIILWNLWMLRQLNGSSLRQLPRSFFESAWCQGRWHRHQRVRMVCAQVAFAVEFGGRSMSVSKNTERISGCLPPSKDVFARQAPPEGSCWTCARKAICWSTRQGVESGGPIVQRSCQHCWAYRHIAYRMQTNRTWGCWALSCLVLEHRIDLIA